MSPPRRSMVDETGDHSWLGRTLAAIAASPSRIKIMAPHLCDSITTTTSRVLKKGGEICAL